MSPWEYLLSRSTPSPEGCRVWAGTPSTPGGYGVAHYRKRKVYAHCLAFEVAYGPISEGVDVDHTCHVVSVCGSGPCIHRLCIEPTHLQAVPHRLNIVRSLGLGQPDGVLVCKHGHDLTLPGAIRNRGKYGNACAECLRRRNREWHASRRAASPTTTRSS